MNEAALKTLFHPFEAGMLDLPGNGTRALVMNAAPDFRLPEGFAAETSLSQDFRPAFLALQATGARVAAEPEGEGYDVVLVQCGRHRGQNELWVAEALRRTRPGGRIVVAGHKTEGAASLRKQLAGLVAVEGHASKSHGIVFWISHGDTALQAADALCETNPPLVLEGGFRTAPGMFSHDRIDAGSRLLAENLPDGLKGVAADFGAGWGYLSIELARRAPGVSAIDLYEASFSACAAANENMAALAPGVAATVLWRDLPGEKAERRYDTVVMNPPFHQGRATEPAIGEAMIRGAAAALKPGGRLLMVANRPLPYEAVLQASFGRCREICRDKRFKVLVATR